jgi:hypothetical protein
MLLAGLFLVRTKGAAQSLPPGSTAGINDGSSLTMVAVAPTVIRGQFVYSVPFLCGTVLTPYGSVSSSSVAASSGLVSGAYVTTIRVHNPDDTASVVFSERAVESQPRQLSRGRISPALQETLRPEDAVEVTCTDLIRLLGTVPPSALVVIRSSAPLDVQAVYSAAGAR